MNVRKLSGLNELPADPRDFSLGAVFPLPKLSELPASFSLGPPLSIKQQFNTDFCTACAADGASEYQEGVEFEPSWGFAQSKALSNDVSAFGQDLRVAMNRVRVKGSLARKDSPYLLDTADITKLKPAEFLRDPKNWPENLDPKALIYAKGAFMQITGPYDHFDNIRAAMWRFRAEKRAITFGLKWNWPAEQHYMTALNLEGDGHAMYTIGWDTNVEASGVDYLETVNSIGKEAGEGGRHWISRAIINKWVAKYGAFMFVDMTPEEYQERLRNLNLSIWVRILQGAVAIVQSFLKLTGDRESFVEEANAPIPVPVPPVPVAETSRLTEWAKAIEKIEDMKKFYAANNNPGALRYSRFQTGVKNGYSTFASYQDGWNALMFQLRIAADGRSRVYSPTDTLLEFFRKYAPAKDRNNPDQYASAVAAELKIPVDTKIGTLI